MISELIKAFFLIFIAEMGDKTQIIAMTFATTYAIKDVILGVSLGVIANHGMAIVLGRFLSKTIPISLMQGMAGLMFVIFGFMTLKDEELDEFKDSRKISPVLTVALTFFIGELGDKTQLTAMTLAIESNYFIVILAGTTLAMIATSSLGIFVGIKIGDKIPELSIKIISSVIFVFLGSLKLFNLLPNTYLRINYILTYLIVVVIIEMSLIMRLRYTKTKQGKQSPMKKAAYDIYKQTELLSKMVEEICLGEEKCGRCSGTRCLIGYIRFILRDARDKTEFYNQHYINLEKLVKKEYDKSKVIEALVLIIKDNERNGWIEDSNFIINKIRFSLEYLLINKAIVGIGSFEEYMIEVKNRNPQMHILIEKGINSLDEKQTSLELIKSNL